MRLLLVEDDEKIASFLEMGLKQNGYTVDLVGDGQTARGFLEMMKYDVIVCDVMLPSIDGLTLIKSFRTRDSQTPVLFLSAKRSVDDRVLGLQSGADDYLTKPFSISELLARLQALLRRTNLSADSSSASASVLTAGDLTLDLLSRGVFRGEVRIDLQLKEFALLEYFMRNQGRVLSKAQILDRVWNYQFDPETNVVDVLVYRLRSKIDKDFDFKHIQNIRGVGYVFHSN